MIRAYEVTRGKVGAKNINPTQVPGIISKKGLTWVIASGLSKDSISKMLDSIKEIPAFLVEDTLTRQRPKVEEFENVLSIIFRSISNTGSHSNQVNIILGKNFVLSVFRENDPAIKVIEETLSKKPGKVSRLGVGYIAYTILNSIVDGYRPAIDELDDRIEKLEKKILANPSASQLKAIMGIKKSDLNLKRSVIPGREVLRSLGGDNYKLISQSSLLYFRDAYSDMVSVSENVETIREAVSSLMEIHISLESNNMNQVMKTLTVVASLVFVPTLISGIYGMNLTRLPILANDPNGFWWIILIMLLFIAGMSVVFKRKHWL